MADETSVEISAEERAEDSKADAWAVVIVFVTAVVMMVHFVSGFSFDF